MLPNHLIADYWAEVQDLLEKDHALSKEQARRGIVEFRVHLDMHQVGDIIYHEDPGRVAEIVAGALEQGGFREPTVGEEVPKKLLRRKNA